MTKALTTGIVDQRSYEGSVEQVSGAAPADDQKHSHEEFNTVKNTIDQHAPLIDAACDLLERITAESGDTESLKNLRDDIESLTQLLASDDTDLDTAQERVDRIKQLIADVESIDIVDVSGLRAELDALALLIVKPDYEAAESDATGILNKPSVDQGYMRQSASGQSGVAVQEGITLHVEYRQISKDNEYALSDIDANPYLLEFDMREGSGLLKLPEGLSENQEVRVRVPWFTENEYLDVVVGDGVAEPIRGVNDMINLSGVLRHEGLAGEFSIVRNKDGFWSIEAPLQYNVPLAYPVVYKSGFSYNGSGATVFRSDTSDGQDYQIEWADGTAVTAASGVSISHTHGTVDGVISAIYADGQMPTNLYLTGDYAGVLHDELLSFNRFNSVTGRLEIRATKQSFDVGLMALALPRMSDGIIVVGDAIDAYGDIGEMSRGWDDFSGNVEFRGALMSIAGSLKDFAFNSQSMNRPVVFSGDGMGIGGSLEDLTFYAPSIRFRIEITGDNQKVSGDYAAALDNLSVLVDNYIIAGLNITTTVNSVPVFDSPMTVIQYEPQSSSSAEVDRVLEGAAGVAAYNTNARVDVGERNDPPSAVSTDVGGWIDQTLLDATNNPAGATFVTYNT